MIYPGSQLGPYHIDRELGRGGMAWVYHAVDEQAGSEVALKVLAPDQARNPTALQRFQQEGAIALRLRHPNIVRAYAAGVLEDYHYIALDYAARGTLATLLDQRPQPMPLAEAVQFLRRVALGLDYAHSRGLLHRDVKPSNILLGPTGQVWLADFGIARRLDKAHTTLTTSAHTIGTPAFMSPEQIRHDAEIDGRSDIYSLGVVAYNLLSGGLPFAAQTQVTLLHKIVYEPPTPPQEHNPTLPPGTCYVLERVLAKDPALRYRTAALFIDELADSPSHTPQRAEWAEVRRAHAHSPEPAAIVGDTVVYQPDPDREPAPVRRHVPQRLGKPVGWLIALAGLGAVILAMLLWSAPQPTTPVTLVADATPTALATSGADPANAAATAAPQPLAATVLATLPPSATITEPVTQGQTSQSTPLVPATPTSAIPPTSTLLAAQGAAVATANAALLTNTLFTPTPPARAPTSTPVSDNTSTPTPTPTRTEQAQGQTRTATTAGQSTGLVVQLLFPAEGETVKGSRTFQWQASGELAAGYTFEPIFWPIGGDPMSDGRGWGGNTANNNLTIDLTKAIPPGEYQWGVRMVTINPYKAIQLISPRRLIIVQRPGRRIVEFAQQITAAQTIGWQQ